jgi:hypothetical protein
VYNNTWPLLIRLRLNQLPQTNCPSPHIWWRWIDALLAGDREIDVPETDHTIMGVTISSKDMVK